MNSLSRNELAKERGKYGGHTAREYLLLSWPHLACLQ